MLNLVCAVEDGERVRSWRVSDQSDVGVADGGIDGIAIVVEYARHLAHLLLYLLLLVNTAHQRGDIAAEGKYAQQILGIVIYGHQLELIIDFPFGLDAPDLPFFIRNPVEVDDVGGVESVKTLQIQVADTEQVLYRGLFRNDILGFAAEHVAGLGIDVHDLAFLVEKHDTHYRGVEYRPVAQRPVFFVTL